MPDATEIAKDALAVLTGCAGHHLDEYAGPDRRMHDAVCVASVMLRELIEAHPDTVSELVAKHRLLRYAGLYRSEAAIA